MDLSLRLPLCFDDGLVYPELRVAIEKAASASKPELGLEAFVIGSETFKDTGSYFASQLSCLN